VKASNEEIVVSDYRVTLWEACCGKFGGGPRSKKGHTRLKPERTIPKPEAPTTSQSKVLKKFLKYEFQAKESKGRRRGSGVASLKLWGFCRDHGGDRKGPAEECEQNAIGCRGLKGCGKVRAGRLGGGLVKEQTM